MKDHLHVNVNVYGNAVVGRSSGTDVLNPKSQTIQNEEIFLDSNGLAEDRFETQLKGLGRYDMVEVDGMDMETVVGYLGFIREQAQRPEGRQLMSLAHHPIDPQQVMQLF